MQHGCCVLPVVLQRRHHFPRFRDLGEMARAMMAASGFPARAWPLAYRHANWLRNRLPAARLDWDTPYFRMFGEPCDLSGVRVFG